MGGRATKFEVNPDVDGCDEIAVQIFHEIGIAEWETNYFYTAFTDMDSTNASLIRMDELFSYFGIKNSPINEKLFKSFDMSHEGCLNFCEFVTMMWHFLSLDPLSDSFYRFIFDLYGDEDGFIQTAKLRNLIADVHHNNSNAHTSSMLNKFHKGAFNAIPFYTFCVVIHAASSILQPISNMQCALRSQLLGVHHWEVVSKARMAKEGSKCIDNHKVRMVKYAVLEREKKERNAYIKQKEIDDAKEFNKPQLTAQKLADKRRTSMMLAYYALKETLPTKLQTKHPPKNKREVLPVTKRRRRSSFLGKPRTFKPSPPIGDRTTQKKHYKVPKVQPRLVDDVQPFDYAQKTDDVHPFDY